MILVTGATGHVSATVCRLASFGHDVAAMARDAPSQHALAICNRPARPGLRGCVCSHEEMVGNNRDDKRDLALRCNARAIHWLSVKTAR
jgi:uncharacterized protein YbjT (DUF2867 family)